MASVNKVIIVGNIGKDPVVRQFNNGGKVVQFSVATSKKFRDASGEMKEETAWHNIRIAGKSAESFEKCGVKKGTSIYLEGEISYRTWNDNAGIRHDMTEIVCFTFQLLGSRQQAQGNASTAYDYSNPPAQQQAPANDMNWQPPDGDDDLLF
jgi:single-strand DNA-binding protein